MYLYELRDSDNRKVSYGIVVTYKYADEEELQARIDEIKQKFEREHKKDYSVEDVFDEIEYSHIVPYGLVLL